MKTSPFILLLCFPLLGCSGYISKSERNRIQYEVFDRAFHGVDDFQEKSGIIFPPGCVARNKCLFGNRNGFDGFARIEVPAEQAKLLEERIAALTNRIANFPDSFATNKCPYFWWPTNLQNVIVSNKINNGRYYVEAYLVREMAYKPNTVPNRGPYEALMLYLKVFGIESNQLLETNTARPPQS